MRIHEIITEESINEFAPLIPALVAGAKGLATMGANALRTVGSTVAQAGASTLNKAATAAGIQNTGVGANPQQTQQMATATLAQQQQNKPAIRKQILDRLKALDDEKRQLMQQLNSL